MSGTEPTLLELDPRGRVSLKKVAGDTQRFLAYTHEDGTIVLEPATVMTEAQARFLAAPEVVDALERAMSQPDKMREYTPGRRPQS
ncbi:hypothetical protein [Luteipulveratus halotolerans]|uniref:Uncharacterized protein n=1 Tax=Luteipulveratus halotolerans TaxID=1631356 RepID=A0A0L6CMC3_9MICO|nr:hypothetical protein [Luteipulveratus halotolerans]KNX38790.1 hypothetical protein VV01_19235 [Luteipulveratus halotolerans]